MLKPGIHTHEAARVQALQGLEILDTAPEERFDRLTRIAQHILQVPIALVSLVDTQRQWFKSRQGLDATETPRDISFCGHAILGADVFVVTDTADDPRFADNPLVTGAPNIRFYAGAPLTLRNGLCVGTLCAIDSQPHQVSEGQLAALRDLAQCVVEELERVRRQKSDAEASLIQARYVQMVESSPDAIISSRMPDDHITSWNPAAQRLFGYTEPEAMGQPMSMLIPPERAAEARDIVARVMNGERIEQYETVRIRKDASPVEVSFSFSPVMDSAGVIVGVSKIARDITDRKNQERIAQERAQQTQAILDNVIDGIITIDDRGTVKSLNRAAIAIFGYGTEEVIGNNVNMFMPEPYHSEHDGYLNNYRSTGVPRIIGTGREVVGRRKDGSTFPMDLAVSRSVHQGRPLFIGLVRDITERKRVEQMKAEFVSTVSHELRTPLTSINGALGLVCGGALGAMSEQAKTMLDIAYKNSQHLTHLINDLLDMEKLAAGKVRFDMQAQELMPLVEQSVESTRAYAQPLQVQLVLTERADGVRVRVDASRLQQVLSNFLSNAAKFSPTGGQVDVVVRQAQGVARVAVIDHGPGIPAEFRGRIFQKFSQADSSDTRQKGGTGLGLAISKELIERMNGVVGFESQEGQGASFYFDLPVLTEPLQATGGAIGDLSGDTRLLVVEDDPDIARLLVMILSGAGYSADVAGTAEQALKLLDERSYAAMTLDLQLPDASGVSLIRLLRGRAGFETFPIFVVSAAVDDGKLEINGDFTAVDWLDKPIDEMRLIAAVQRCLPVKSPEKVKILHVEDDADLHHVVSTLGRDVAEFDIAYTLAKAREKLARHHYDLVILDIGLPDGSGWSLLPDINALQPVPRVIILSGAEVSAEQQISVHQTFVKSRTSPQNLIDTIRQGIACPIVNPRKRQP